jgi:hypothetical protein
MREGELLNEVLRQDCTLDAVSRLNKRLAKALCVALSVEHSSDEFIENELKRHRENSASTKGLEIRSFGRLRLKLWYTPGNVAECQRPVGERKRQLVIGPHPIMNYLFPSPNLINGSAEMAEKDQFIYGHRPGLGK